jgi:hypothetical protein
MPLPCCVRGDADAAAMAAAFLSMAGETLFLVCDDAGRDEGFFIDWGVGVGLCTTVTVTAAAAPVDDRLVVTFGVCTSGTNRST